jgi:hypothetical protein
MPRSARLVTRGPWHFERGIKSKAFRQQDSVQHGGNRLTGTGPRPRALLPANGSAANVRDCRGE